MSVNRAEFFASIRPRIGPFSSSQVAGIERILDAAAGAPLSHQAYMLATVWHESNKTMEPVREAYWLSEAWRKKHLRYWPWYGRGDVQLTWEYNYKKADAACASVGLCKPGEILANPDKVMDPKISAFILRRGMDEGWFTGVKLRDCLPMKGVATRVQYMNARTIINGRDKADLIEDYAQVFERGLRAGGLS